MKGFRKAGWLAVVLIVAMGVFCGNALAEVTVYAEGAYSNSDLVVYIYADINPSPDPILSYGVKLTYNPTELLFPPAATLNENVWYMGSPPPNHFGCNHCVDTSVAGEVILVGPRLDTDPSTPSSPTDGVSGDKVLLGSVRFNRSSTTTPIANPETFFNIQLSLGKTNPNPSYKFVNFASTQGADLDSTVDFATKGVIIRERGDANGDGSVTPTDMIAVKNAYYAGATLSCEPAADCNDDGNITPTDMICIKNKYYNP